MSNASSGSYLVLKYAGYLMMGLMVSSIGYAAFISVTQWSGISV